MCTSEFQMTKRLKSSFVEGGLEGGRGSLYCLDTEISMMCCIKNDKNLLPGASRRTKRISI